MKKNWLCLVAGSLLALLSCSNKREELNNLAVECAKNNNDITETEYKRITDFIYREKGNKTFKKFFSDSSTLNHNEIINHLVSLFKQRKLQISDESLWNPSSQDLSSSKFIMNVFVENSASMDGYVKGITDFETALYNLLGDIKTSDDCLAMNLNYINKRIPYSKKDALQDDIKDFIEKLEPTVFRSRGGDRSVSDIGDILDTLLKVVDTSNVVLFVSDCVFSAGKNKDGQDYLNNQSVSVKIDFAEKLKNFDLSVVLLKLKSSYNGSYYDKFNTPIPLNTYRPYYIWLIGSYKQITNLIESGVLEKIKGGFLNKQVFATYNDCKKPEFKILMNRKKGSFRLSNNAQGPIKNAKAIHEGNSKVFSFTIAVDFSKYLRDESYFLDSNIYTTNANYTISVKPINDKTDISIKDYTHLLTLTTTTLRNEELKISVLDILPSWVEQSTSNDDTNIKNDSGEWGKTFGLKYLVEGMNDAYLQKTNTKILGTISIDIIN